MSDPAIDEAGFLRRRDASFECGVRFRGRSLHADGRPRDFIHPFNAARAPPGAVPPPTARGGPGGTRRARLRPA